MSSQSIVIGSGLSPSIFVDVLMAQLVRALTGWARRLVPCLGRVPTQISKVNFMTFPGLFQDKIKFGQ